MRSHVISFRLTLVLLLTRFVLLTACGQNSAPATGAKPTPTVAFDFYGTPIVFPTTAPRRIVSLLPSTSEMLGALHLQGRSSLLIITRATLPNWHLYQRFLMSMASTMLSRSWH